MFFLATGVAASPGTGALAVASHTVEEAAAAAAASSGVATVVVGVVVIVSAADDVSGAICAEVVALADILIVVPETVVRAIIAEGVLACSLIIASKSVMGVCGVIAEGVVGAHPLIAVSKAVGIVAILKDIAVLCHWRVIIALADPRKRVAVTDDVAVPISIAAIGIVVIVVSRIIAATEETHLKRLSLPEGRDGEKVSKIRSENCDRVVQSSCWTLWCLGERQASAIQTHCRA